MLKHQLFQPGQHELNDIETTVMDIVKRHNTSDQGINSQQLQQLTGYSPDTIQQATQSLKAKGLLLASSRPPQLI